MYQFQKDFENAAYGFEILPILVLMIVRVEMCLSNRLINLNNFSAKLQILNIESKRFKKLFFNYSVLLKSQN